MISSLELEYLNKYMDEYYNSFSTENKIIGDFILSESINNAEVLDVGCGPIIIYWSFFNPYAKSIMGLDFKKDSISFIKEEIQKIKTNKIPPRYLDVSDYISKKVSTISVQELVDKISVESADLTSPWPIKDNSKDLVISIFGLDCLESSKQFEFCLEEAKRVLKPNGKIVLITLCNTNTWHCGDAVIKCLNLNEDLIKEYLKDFTVSFISTIDATTAIEKNQGYEKMLFCSAIKSVEL